MTDAYTPPAWLPFIAGGPSAGLDDMPVADWEQALAMAHHGGVLEALAVRLRTTGATESLPSELQPQLEDAERRAAVSVLSSQRIFVLIARALASGDIPVVPYKGIDLAHTVYPDVRMRPMSDVDVWVRAEQLSAALEALAKAGLVEKASPPTSTMAQRPWFGAAQLGFAHGQAAVAEVQLGPLSGEWLHRAASIDRAGMWDRLQGGELLGHAVRRLAREDHALQVALHAAITHQFSSSPLRQLLDLVLLARAGLDADALVARAASWRVTRAVALTFQLATSCFGDTATAHISERFESATSTRAGRRAWGMPDVKGILHGRRLSRSQVARFLFQLRVTDSWADTLRLVSWSVVPDRAWLEARYGSGTLATRVRHLLWLARGGRRGAQR